MEVHHDDTDEGDGADDVGPGQPVRGGRLVSPGAVVPTFIASAPRRDGVEMSGFCTSTTSPARGPARRPARATIEVCMCGGSRRASRWRAKWNGLRPSGERMHAVGRPGADHDEATVARHALLAVAGVLAGADGTHVEHVGAEVQAALVAVPQRGAEADAEPATRPGVAQVAVAVGRQVAHPHLVVGLQHVEPRRDVVEVLVVGAGDRRVDAEPDDVEPGGARGPRDRAEVVDGRRRSGAPTTPA